MKRTTTRVLSLLLTLCLIVGLLPTVALATEDGGRLSVSAETLFPCEEQKTGVTVTGGSGTQTVRISGYRAPWYVTDGLILHYDAIYNQGVGQKHDSSAATWKDLAGSFDFAMPDFASGEGWTETGLYLKETAAKTKRFSSTMSMTDGFTLDYSFALDQEYANWTKGSDYKYPIQVTSGSLLGTIGKCGTNNGDTWVLFYGGGHNTILKTPPFDTSLAQLTLTTGGVGTVRTAYRDGAPMSTYNDKPIPSDTSVFQLIEVSLPKMSVAAAASADGNAFSLGRTLYGLRLYNRQLSAGEVAKNAETDRLRYEDDSWNNDLGTFNDKTLTEQFDETGNSYIDVEVTFNDAGTATIPLVLNNAGAEKLTFSIVEGDSVTEIGTLSMTVLTEAERQKIQAAQAAIDALPRADEITKETFNNYLSTVAAAQAAFADLDEALQAAISDEDKANLAACVAAINASAAGNLTVTVTYDANAGTITPASKQITYGAAYELDIPTRSNYTFTGWYADAALGTQLTGADGKSLENIVWESLSDATVYAGWQHNIDAKVPLEIDEPEDVYALARILGKSGTPDDYGRFGMTESNENQAVLRKADYVLKTDIALTNHTGDSSNGFYGIPNFQGTFDGQNHTITLDIDFSKYTHSSDHKDIGGVFQTVTGATVKNVNLAGAASGTLTLKANTCGIGLLIGKIEAGKCAVENISSDVAVNMTLDSNTNYCCYFAPVVGYLYPSNADIVLKDCENTGAITAAAVQSNANASRVGGLVGHSGKGTTLESCKNLGAIAITGDRLIVGDLQGSSNGTTYRNCVSAGSITVETGSPNIFTEMHKECAQADGNVIRVSVTGQAGQTITAQGGVSVTLESGKAATIDLPVFRAGRDAQLYSKYVIDEDIKVDGQRSLYLFDLFSREFITSLNTEDATAEALPFSSWATAIPISTQADFLNMCKAFDDKNEDAIKALYQLGGRDLGSTDLDTAQLVLRSAYYVLKNDVTIDDADFAGIGRVNSFGGHFDGNGHTVTYTIHSAFESASSSVYYGLFGSLTALTDGVVEVKNLDVAATLDITAGSTGSYAINVGGLAGSAGNNMTTENVHVTVKGINVEKNGAGTGSGDVGGVFGVQNGTLLGTAPDVTIAGPVTVSWTESTGGCDVGGFAGRSVMGGNVEFAAGSSGIQAIITGNANSRVGGITGYSWSANDFSGLSVKNSSGEPITLSGGERGTVGLLIGYYTTSSATPDAIALQANNVNIDGAFRLSGKNVGGLFGVADTSGRIIIQNTAVSRDITLAFAENATAPIVGGLIGQISLPSTSLEIKNSASGAILPADIGIGGGLIGTNASTSVICEDSVYVKDTENRKAVANKTDLPSAVALDITKLTGCTFGTPVEALSADAPSSLAVAGDAELDGKNVTFTKAGDSVSATFMWEGTELYTATANVTPLNVSGTAEIADLMSEYLHTGSAITPKIQVVNDGVLLVEGTDYTVEYKNNIDIGSATITVTFAGNYTGTKEASFAISDASLDVTAEGYTAVYDGAAHSITVNAPDGAAITYGASAEALSNTIIEETNVCTRIIYWKVEQDGKSVTGSSVLSITPRPLTITADNKTISVGDALPEYTYTVTGLIGEDVLTTMPTLACDALDSKTAGAYTITVSGADAGGNYAIIYVDGTLTVSKRSGGDEPEKPVLPPIIPRPPVMPVMPGLPFRDVDEDDWYYDAVEYVYEEGLMNGVGAGKFNPMGDTTRGMIVTILYRQSGSPKVVSDKATWWSDARVWAMEEGISDGTNMNGKITREQLAAMLYRYAKAIGADTSARGNLNRFSDSAKISSWAVEAMQWATGEGILTGRPNGTLDPKGLATRAEVAAMFMRFDKTIG